MASSKQLGSNTNGPESANFLAEIHITLKPTVNDPQGRTVLGALKTLSFNTVSDVRVGKYLELHLQEINRSHAKRRIEAMCKKLLANPVIENFKFKLVQLK